MKWLKVLLCVVFLAAVVTVPTGCRKGEITDLTPSDETGLLPDHEAGAKDILQGKKPADLK